MILAGAVVPLVHLVASGAIGIIWTFEAGTEVVVTIRCFPAGVVAVPQVCSFKVASGNLCDTAAADIAPGQLAPVETWIASQYSNKPKVVQ